MRRALWIPRTAAVVLAMWWLIAWGAARMLIVRAELARADAVVVLSGSGAYMERSHHAAQLWATGRVPRIILTLDDQPSGWSDERQRNPLFVEREIDELQAAGVPPDRIEVIPTRVSSTYDEALAVQAYAASHQLRSLIVVTSGYHSRRALWTFRSVFGNDRMTIGIDGVPAGRQTPLPAVWWWTTRGWQAVAGEYVKLAYYRLKYDRLRPSPQSPL